VSRLRNEVEFQLRNLTTKHDLLSSIKSYVRKVVMCIGCIYLASLLARSLCLSYVAFRGHAVACLVEAEFDRKDSCTIHSIESSPLQFRSKIILHSVPIFSFGR
jgi:hypothetical protein